jgi:hypothetical protein
MELATSRGLLTTDHAASSYGQPVLVVDGVAHGPGDLLADGEIAALAVRDELMAITDADTIGALEVWLTWGRGPGRPRVHQEGQMQISVRIPESLWRRLQTAMAEGRSQREILVEALERWLDEEDG